MTAQKKGPDEPKGETAPPKVPEQPKRPNFLPQVVKPQRQAREDTHVLRELSEALGAREKGRRASIGDRLVSVRPDTLYYIECHHCLHPGIWMSQRGEENGLDDDEWWADYKLRGAPWAQTVVFCNWCLDQVPKQTHQLKIRKFGPHRFGPNPRQTREVPIKEATALLDQFFGKEEEEVAAV